MEIVSPAHVEKKFSFGNMNSQFSTGPSYKRYPIYPAPFRGVDVFASNFPQPLAACKDCFPHPTPFDQCDYVDLFEFANFGGMPYPLAPGVSVPQRFASDLRYTISTPLPHKYPRVHDDVLTSARVLAMVESQAEKLEVDVQGLRKKAARFFTEIRATLNRAVCKVCGYLLFKVFRRLMKRLLVSPLQLKAVQEAEKSGVPIVYLPLHRSHLDYLLITWCMWHFGLRLPHIASGDNLNLSGFGWLLRSTGAFFIRRRLDASDEGGKDILYRTVLRSYLEQILNKDMPIEFFLEGTRSRFGKSLLPKNGLISNVVEAVQQGVIPDVHLVPVSYTYDQVAEGVFLNELMGIPKQRESIWGVVKGVWKGFGVYQRCGNVRMHFGKPVLLSEYLSALTASLSHPHLDDLQSKQLTRMPHTFSYRELVPWTQASIENNRALIRAIGYHVMYEAQDMCSISPVSIVSTLLLCKYRHGTKISNLGADVQWLSECILNQGGDIVGWRRDETSGEAMVEYALNYISDSTTRHGDQIEPIGTHRQLIHLAYSKNALVPKFAIKSAIALVIVSNPFNCEMKVEQILERTLMVCDWMQNEVIFCKPCEDLRERIKYVLSEADLSNKFTGVVTIGNNRYDDDDDDGAWSDGDIEQKVIEVPSTRCADVIVFFSHFLRPFMQSLYLVLHRLQTVKDDPMRETEFVRELIRQTLAKTPAELPFDLLLECVNSDTIKNCLRVLREKGVIGKEGFPIEVLDEGAIEKALKDVAELLEIH